MKRSNQSARMRQRLGARETISFSDSPPERGPPKFPLIRGPGYASLWAETIGEFISTTIFLFFANGAAITAGKIDANASPATIDQTYFLIQIVVAALGGAFATYAVTVIFASFGVLTAFNWSISIAHFAFYAIVDPMQRTWHQVWRATLHIVAQFLGALASVLLLWTFRSHSELEQAAPRLSTGTSEWSGFFSEMIIGSFVYFLFIFSGVAQLRKRPVPISMLVSNDRAFLFALLVASAVFTGGETSGTYISANRYLALATITGTANNAAVFVLGPLVAVIPTIGLLVGTFWLFKVERKSKNRVQAEDEDAVDNQSNESEFPLL